jgi:hypothetical protein
MGANIFAERLSHAVGLLLVTALVLVVASLWSAISPG